MDPQFAVNYLKEISSDVRVAVLVGPDGKPEAATVDTVPKRVPGLVKRLFEQAQAAARTRSDVPDQVEVATPDGDVFCSRAGGRTLVAVAGRFALPSLMFYDMLTVLRILEAEKGEQ